MRWWGQVSFSQTMRGGGVPFRMTGCKQTLTHAYDPVWRTQAVSYCFHCTHVGMLDPLVDGPPLKDMMGSKLIGVSNCIWRNVTP